MFRRDFLNLAAQSCALPVVAARLEAIEQRNDIAYLHGPYNGAFFHNHNRDFRMSAGLHFSHGKQHDVLLLNPFSTHEATDARFEKESLNYTYKPPRTEPTMEYFGPYTARAMYSLYRAIDWTHMHHEQTYDILSDPKISWAEKKTWTERSVRYYLTKMDLPRSCAPLDVTMRRAAVMMKPYFTLFRNYYPKSNNFFYGAHWWHPVAYEAMMIAGNGDHQTPSLEAMEKTYLNDVIKNEPLRMMLSRELMPRYSRLSPESANIFDNLHMLHGIAYDVLSYEKWSIDQKRKEIYRVLNAMRYQPGDDLLARKFRTPHPDMDPRVYSPWMKGPEGEMSRIMMEMLEEMMPMMMPGITPEQKQEVMKQAKVKMTPGLQPEEQPGSLHDALMKVYPAMKMMPGSAEPGEVASGMVAAMLNGWREKYGMMPDIEPQPMDREPVFQPPSGGTVTALRPNGGTV